MSSLHLFAILLLLASAGIVFKQRQAKTCSRHSALAGLLAWVLAAICAGFGALLLMADLAGLH